MSKEDTQTMEDLCDKVVDAVSGIAQLQATKKEIVDVINDPNVVHLFVVAGYANGDLYKAFHGNNLLLAAAGAIALKAAGDKL